MTYCGPWLEAVELCDEAANPLLPRALDVASELIYVLTGRQFAGRCTDTVLPCSTGGACVQYLAYPSGGSRPINGAPSLSGPPFCGSHHQSVRLPGRPIIEVTEMLIGGVAFTDFAIVDDTWLVRTDGAAWPCCQDFDDPTAWQVTYTYGSAPHQPGLLATR